MSGCAQTSFCKRVQRWVYMRRNSMRSAIQCGSLATLEKLLRVYANAGVLRERLAEAHWVGHPLPRATALQLAYLYGESEMVSVLVHRGASLTEDQAHALLKLCFEDRFYYYPRLLARVLSHSELRGEDLLIYACHLQNYPLVEDLLSRGISPDCPTGALQLKTTPMLIAAEQGDVRLLRLLLQRRARATYSALLRVCTGPLDAMFVEILLHDGRLGPDVYMNDRRMYLFQYVLEREHPNKLAVARVLLEAGVVYFYLIPKFHRIIWEVCATEELRAEFLRTVLQYYPEVLRHYGRTALPAVQEPLPAV